jgi:hypothetical protein
MENTNIDFDAEIQKRISILDETGIILFGEANSIDIPKGLNCPIDVIHTIEADDIKDHVKCEECNKRWHYSQCTNSLLMSRFYLYDSIKTIIKHRNDVNKESLLIKLRDYNNQLKTAQTQNNDRMIERITGRIEVLKLILENLKL